jgi:hypothetical protein
MKTGRTIFMIEGIISAILGQTIYYDWLLILPDIKLILYSIIFFLILGRTQYLISNINVDSKGGLSQLY